MAVERAEVKVEEEEEERPEPTTTTMAKDDPTKATLDCPHATQAAAVVFVKGTRFEERSDQSVEVFLMI